MDERIIRADIVGKLIHTMNGSSAEDIVRHAAVLEKFVTSGKNEVRVVAKAKTSRRKK